MTPTGLLVRGRRDGIKEREDEMHKMSDEEIAEMIGKMLIQLIKEHKKSCNQPDCGISVSLFSKVFENIVNRKATTEEAMVFI